VNAVSCQSPGRRTTGPQPDDTQRGCGTPNRSGDEPSLTPVLACSDAATGTEATTCTTIASGLGSATARIGQYRSPVGDKSLPKPVWGGWLGREARA
jgi:hypothetical protein